MTKELSRRATLIAAGLLPLGWAMPALAADVSFQVALSGAQSVPPVDIPGKGTADLTYDPTARLVTWSITYGDLGSPVTMAHFHDGGTGQNGKVEIWLTKKGEPVSSPIKGSATLTPDQAQEFLAGDLYINVHTKDHPAGAIRGQVVPPKS
jgi:CHRD domain-containing protein